MTNSNTTQGFEVTLKHIDAAGNVKETIKIHPGGIEETIKGDA